MAMESSAVESFASASFLSFPWTMIFAIIGS